MHRNIGTQNINLQTVDVGEDARMSQCLQSLHSGTRNFQLAFASIFDVECKHRNIFATRCTLDNKVPKKNCT